MVGAGTIELQDVSIHADGTVTSRSTGPADPAAVIRCLGQVLAHLLPPKDSMFLRERVVEKAISCPPFYLSVQELSATLDYYERPGRAIQVRNVYERWQERHTPFLAPASAGSHRIQRAAQLAIGAVSARPDLLKVAAVAAGAIAVLVVVGRLVGSSSLFAPAPAPVPRAAAPPVAAPATPVVETPTAVAAQPTTPPASTTARRTEIRPPASQPSKPPAARPAPATRASAEPTPAPPVRPAPAAPAASAPVPTTGASDAGHITLRLADSTFLNREFGGQVAPAAPLPAEEPAIGNAGVVYSAGDRDVIPPTVLFSQLPGPSPVFTPQHDIPALEVFVNEKGTVDSVRAIARPRNIAESVVLTNGLSAAKAWRFRPATKEGRAVRYRLIVVLSTD
jgi:hypothetical protein